VKMIRDNLLLWSLAVGAAVAAPSASYAQLSLGGSEAGSGGALCTETVDDHLADALAEWRAFISSGPDWSDPAVRHRSDQLLKRTFDFDEVGRRIFGDGDWEELGEYRRSSFRGALAHLIRSRLLAATDSGRADATVEAAHDEPEKSGDLLRVRYDVEVGERDVTLDVFTAASSEGSCGIVDLRIDDQELVKDTREQVEDLIDEYSFNYMIARLSDADHVVLEDFEATPEGELPVGWGWRDGDDAKNKPYRVRSENGNKYLEATDEGESVILGRDVRWDVWTYPYISFRVRVRRIPEGGNERYDDLVDSAAGIYVTLNTKFFGKIPESVKYVWSSTLPVGTAVRREGIGRPWQVVMGSGTEGLGEWRTYVFDVRQAYTDTFGDLPPSKTHGIGVLSDANSLDAQAYADYDDFRALRTAPPGVTSGVEQILPPLGRKNGDEGN